MSTIVNFDKYEQLFYLTAKNLKLLLILKQTHIIQTKIGSKDIFT